MQAIAKRPIIWQKFGFICIFLILCLTACERPPQSAAPPAAEPPPAARPQNSAHLEEKPAVPEKDTACPVRTGSYSNGRAGGHGDQAARGISACDKKPAADPVDATATPPVASLPDPKTMVKKSDDLMRGDSVQGTYIMEITTPSWTRTLELAVHSKGRDRIFIRILSPAKEAGTGTLRIDNEMWNYLPRIEKVIKIPPSMMLQSWMGSDFANDDLVKENSIVDDYTHRIVAEETVRGEPTYKIELIPKPGAAVIWGKLYYWIRPADYVPIRQDYYDERGRLVKRLEYSDIEKVSDRTVPRTWMMTNHIKKGKTTRIYLKDVVYNQPVDDNLFTLSNLKRLN